MTNNVLANSPNWAPHFLYKQFERIMLFNFHNLFHLINSKFLIISYTILFELCKEKLDIDKLPGAERVNQMLHKKLSLTQVPILTWAFLILR